MRLRPGVTRGRRPGGWLISASQLHPLIVAVRERPPAAGALRSYAITDRLAWGPLRFRIGYQADVRSGRAAHLVLAERLPAALEARDG